MKCCSHRTLTPSHAMRVRLSNSKPLRLHYFGVVLFCVALGLGVAIPPRSSDNGANSSTDSRFKKCHDGAFAAFRRGEFAPAMAGLIDPDCAPELEVIFHSNANVAALSLIQGGKVSHLFQRSGADASLCSSCHLRSVVGIVL